MSVLRFSLSSRLVFFLLITCLILSFVGSRDIPYSYAQGDNPPTPSNGATIHIVQRGETLFAIAQKYGATIDDIARVNGLTDPGQLQIGQRLLIPSTSPVVPTAEGMTAPSDPPMIAAPTLEVATNADAPANPPISPANAAQPGMPTTYVLQPGDTLFNLSWRYSMDVTAIARLNKMLNPAQPIYAGQTLAIQEGANGRPTVKTGRLYVVQKDDNLFRVAARYGMSMDRLIKANKFGKVPVVFPGQHLVIPGAADGPILLDVPEPFDRVKMVPDVPEQGRTMSLHLTTIKPTRLSGQFMGKPLIDFADATRTNHTIIIGIDAFAKPGVYTADILAVDDANNQSVLSRNIKIADGGYPSEEIALPAEQMDLLDAKVTLPEFQKVLNAVSKYSDQQFINGPMGLPCAAAVTSQFGTRRSYNNGPFNQVHTGTDFAALPGSPINAPAGGVVVLAEPLHVRGNATIIDHGHGVFTGYWHQTELKVKVGDVVAQGQEIGTVGGTGRATGPHLHWEIFVGGVQVDPLQWTKQNFW